MKSGLALVFVCQLGSLLSAAEMPLAAEHSGWVTIVGSLRSGIVAIGGETTGTVITAQGRTWELDLASAELRAAAEKLNGKRVVVEGSLVRREGVEIRDRRIISVSSLKAAPAGAVDSAVRVEARRSDSRIRIAVQDGATVLEVRSDFGIDRAKVDRLRDTWPQPIVVRLHLRGLESFKAIAGDTALQWSLSSNAGGTSHLTLWRGNREQPIDDASPFYSQARSVARGQPPRHAYFEVPLPAKLFEGNPQRIMLEWIDFYRG